MKHNLRTGDILLVKGQDEPQTFMYLITDDVNGFGLVCMTCGNVICVFDNSIEFADYIKNDLDVIGVIPKETMAAIVNVKCFLSDPIKIHNTFNDYDLNLEIELL